VRRDRARVPEDKALRNIFSAVPVSIPSMAFEVARSERRLLPFPFRRTKKFDHKNFHRSKIFDGGMTPLKKLKKTGQA
jgi:hypothetical protein